MYLSYVLLIMRGCIAGNHLAYQWSYDAVDQLGYALKERCATVEARADRQVGTQ